MFCEQSLKFFPTIPERMAWIIDAGPHPDATSAHNQWIELIYEQEVYRLRRHISPHRQGYIHAARFSRMPRSFESHYWHSMQAVPAVHNAITQGREWFFAGLRDGKRDPFIRIFGLEDFLEQIPSQCSLIPGGSYMKGAGVVDARMPVFGPNQS